MRNYRLLLVSLTTGILALWLAANPAAGQSDRGAIGGTVTDSSGAVVPGATVTATGADTGIVYKTTTTSAGSYHFLDVQVGAYNGSASADKFKTQAKTGLAVQINT